KQSESESNRKVSDKQNKKSDQKDKDSDSECKDSVSDGKVTDSELGGKDNEYKKIKKSKRIFDALKNPTTIYILLYFSINVTRSNYIISTINKQLKNDNA